MSKLSRLFFFLTIVFLPTQLGYHFWPEWAFILGRRVDYLSPTLYVTDILILFTLISWASSVILSPPIGGRRISELVSGRSHICERFFAGLRMTKHISLILILFFVGINIFLAINKPVAIYSWFKVLEFSTFGYYIVKTKPKISDLTIGLSIAIFYSSIIAIIQFFFQRAIGGPLWFLGERTFSHQTPGIAQINFCFLHQCRLLLRPYATFPHPNVLGGFLAVTLPLIIQQILQISQIRQIKKYFFVFSSILGSIALILTFSRSAWLIGTLGIGWIFIPKKLKTIYTLCSVAAFSLGIFLVKDFAGASESVVVREQLNASAITLWNRSPLFGIGLGNFLTNLPAVLPSRAIYFLQPVHNIYLLLLSETGVIGLSIFLFLIFKIFYKKNLSLNICHLSVLSLLFLGLVDHYPLTLQQGQILLTLFLSLSLLKKFD